MSERKNVFILVGFVLSISLISSSLTAFLLKNYDQQIYFQVFGEICQEVIEQQPEARTAFLSVLKEYPSTQHFPKDATFLLSFGYTQANFLHLPPAYPRLFVAVGFAAGAILFLSTLIYKRKKEVARIKMLTDYLEQVNTSHYRVLFPTGEDEFSKLQDEIYKTVTMLYQTRDAALKTKENFAENLYNIAHQIKTPITSISLSAQMWEEIPSPKYLEQIRCQLSRLTHLEEALLLLSRMDAGTLTLERKDVDVFTVLTLAADNLQEMVSGANISVDISESGETIIHADLDWTMEAFINLLKNCIEHTPPGGSIHCTYEQNPIYTRIQIWDTGRGFAKKDIPHLFERFYRGENSGKGGIGIGLALSKAIIESQNGTISARNLPTGGACFEIRFYTS
ncbi:MAG: HAMP domain-containing histidine kinase [Lachnospiraceae bacterium]|nr:HAMP domain-containing histidine kinase [Lachnospiraceae bacterium]